MWFKNAASNVWNATKNILVDNRTPAKKLIDEIVQSSEDIIPTTKLNELAALTFDLESFQEIVDLAIERIRVFKYDLEEARKNLNMLIVINYLIKHGATAFVDELRSFIPTFKKYQTLEELRTYEDSIMQGRLNYELEKIKSRAQHIQTLLEDKQKLLKEKELSMLIKQKLKLYEKEKLGDIKSTQNNPKEHSKPRNAANPVSSISQAEKQQRMSKLEWMMEKYLWKYVDKLDGKLEEVSDKVLEQVDKYVLGEMPEKFELEDDDEEEEQRKEASSPERHANKGLQDEKEDELMKRLEEQGDANPQNHANLLEFEEVIEAEVQKPLKPVQNYDLI